MQGGRGNGSVGRLPDAKKGRVSGLFPPSGRFPLFDEFRLLRHRRCAAALEELEGELVVVARDADDAALGEMAEQQLLGQRLLDCSWITRASGRAPNSWS